jgi:hypothetical protein
MNKNSKRQTAYHRKTCRAQGQWPTHGFKKKAQPFPRPGAHRASEPKKAD